MNETDLAVGGPRPASNDDRRSTLRTLLDEQGRVRLLEVHSPVSAVVAEQARVTEGGEVRRFDGFWSSSLTDSTVAGLPDIEVLGARNRLATISDIFAVTSSPLVMDGDTGGLTEHFAYTVRDLERAGVSAVIIEDKCGLKQNSLLGTTVEQSSEEPAVFAEKIAYGKRAQVSDDFMIIARIESLILELGLDDALARADTYMEAGADGVMIHSRRRSPREVLDFAEVFRRRHPDVPLVCVPTTYNTVPADALHEAGFQVVIYANHMLRAALKAMREVSTGILRAGCTASVEDACADLADVLSAGVELDTRATTTAAHPLPEAPPSPAAVDPEAVA